MTFRGLSSPDELKTTWFNMTEGQDLPKIKIIWDFDSSLLSSLNSGLYVVNLLYPYIGDKTGHYVALFKFEDTVFYFDPLGTLPPKEILSSLSCIIVDLEGAQAINGNSCGYRCLAKLLKYSLGHKPKYFIKIQGGEVKGTLKPETIQKTKREFKILQSLKQ